MLTAIFTLLVGTLCDLLALAFLIRFAMQWLRVPFWNPFGRFVLALTDWAVLPARKVVPSLFGLDLASLLLAWLVQILLMSMVIALRGESGGAISFDLGLIVVISGLIEVLRLAVYLAMGVIIIWVVLSWVNPHSPIAPLFNQLAAPMLKPFRRLIPPIGGVDLSPLVALLLLQVVLILLHGISNLLLSGH
jgi:YggT family protein